VSTDDPAMFGTDLSADYAAARQLGVPARDCYQAGLRGALCDQRTRNELQQVGEAFRHLSNQMRHQAAWVVCGEVVVWRVAGGWLIHALAGSDGG